MEADRTADLLPCPFCKGAAELDTRQGYTYVSHGQARHGTAVAVYCTECSVQISVCREDVPDISSEAAIEMWNRRATAPAAPAPLPTGWKLMPPEATEEMVEAVNRLGMVSPAKAYTVMLAAAPQPSGAAPVASDAVELLRAAFCTSVSDGSEGLYELRFGFPTLAALQAAHRAWVASPAPAVRVPLQQRVQPWMMACFGQTISADTMERNHRFFEESTELVQSCGMTASEAHQLVDYVYGRPVGEKFQEAGGVMITLAALCLAQGMDMEAAGETELARIWTKVDAIRAKQAAKPAHSPLPEAAHGIGSAIPSEPATPATPLALPGIDDRAKAWDKWHQEWLAAHRGCRPDIGDAFDAAYRIAWKRATVNAGKTIPASPEGGK